MRARALPCASSASCVGRTLTMANSAATKNPFAATNRRARSTYQTFMRERPRILACGQDDLVQRPPEAGVRLRYHPFAGDGNTSAGQAGNRERHRDPVVIMGLDRRLRPSPAGLYK